MAADFFDDKTPSNEDFYASISPLHIEIEELGVMLYGAEAEHSISQTDLTIEFHESGGIEEMRKLFAEMFSSGIAGGSGEGNAEQQQQSKVVDENDSRRVHSNDFIILSSFDTSVDILMPGVVTAVGFGFDQLKDPYRTGRADKAGEEVDAEAQKLGEDITSGGVFGIRYLSDGSDFSQFLLTLKLLYANVAASSAAQGVEASPSGVTTTESGFKIEFDDLNSLDDFSRFSNEVESGDVSTENITDLVINDIDASFVLESNEDAVVDSEIEEVSSETEDSTIAQTSTVTTDETDDTEEEEVIDDTSSADNTQDTSDATIPVDDSSDDDAPLPSAPEPDPTPPDTTASAPSLTVSNASGNEDSAISLSVSTSLTDTDGSESIASLEVSDIPIGAKLSDGTNNFTATTGNTSVDVKGWTLGSLTITPASNDSDDFTLTVTSTSQESSNGAQASVSDTIDVTVNPVADFSFNTTSSNPEESSDYLAIDIPLILNLPSGLLATDTLAVTIGDIPVYGSVFSGENFYLRGGAGQSSTVDVSDWDLRTLQFTSRQLATADYDITITITVSGSVSYTDSATVTISQFSSADSIQGSGTIDGTSGQNYIVGSTGVDTIDAMEGNDFVYARDAADDITAGEGNDVVVSGNNAETTTLNEGNDIVYGGANQDTMYGNEGDDQLYGGAVRDFAYGGDGDDIIGGTDGNNPIFNDTYDGGAGNDTLTYRDATLNISVDLSVTSAQSTGQGNDTITNIENVIGGSGNDTLTGDANDNVIDGYLGDDTLNGAGGTDTVSYDSLVNNLTETGVTVSLALQGSSQNTVGAGSDTLSNFENIRGSQYDDTLTGDSSNNEIEGGLGDDTLNGAGGSEDIASYEHASGAVTVSLASQGGSQNTSSAGNDTLTNFEGLKGSDYNDTLTGDSSDNIFYGGAGNDIINGGSDNYLSAGGTGGDIVSYADLTTSSTLTTISGDDPSGGTNSITINGVIVNLSTGQTTGNAGTDTLSDIEHIIGSDFNDQFYTNSDDNKITTGDGEDVITAMALPEAVYITDFDVANDVLDFKTELGYTNVEYPGNGGSGTVMMPEPEKISFMDTTITFEGTAGVAALQIDANSGTGSGGIIYLIGVTEAQLSDSNFIFAS